MAYVPAVNDILEVTVLTVDGSQIGLNRTHWRVKGLVTGGATMLEIAQALDGTWAAAYKTLINNNATYRGTQVQKIWPLPRIFPESSVALTAAGTGGANALPKQTAAVIGFQTAKAGQAYRGRMYVPFPSATANDVTGVPTGAYMTKIANLITAYGLGQTIVGATGSTDMDLVIWHAKAGLHGLPLAHTYDPATNATSKAQWATQRRRGDYGQINKLPF